jgi:hypothetical protein
MRKIFLMLLFSAQSVAALPEFAGARADDKPIHALLTSEASDKNSNVAIADIGELVLDSDEMIIRIYAGFGEGIVMRGGHPLSLHELKVTTDALALTWYAPCPGLTTSRGDPARAWQVIQDQDLFSIRGSDAYADYPRVLDGTSYLVQIKTAAAYREFYVSNPTEYTHGDNPRLLTILRAIGEEFDEPVCGSPQ